MTNITVRTQPEETHKYLLIFVLELFDNYDTISEIVIDYSMRVGLGPLSIVVGIIFYRRWSYLRRERILKQRRRHL